MEIHQHQVARKRIDKKNDQITKAVEWCIENNARGHAALKTGMFNLIKDRGTIDRRLDGKVKTGIEKQYCSILTAAEENSIVLFVKNKNRCLQGVNKKELTKLILDVLKIRQHTNHKIRGGRSFVKLSEHAKRALQNQR